MSPKQAQKFDCSDYYIVDDMDFFINDYAIFQIFQLLP